jgi:hypothetical protein
MAEKGDKWNNFWNKLVGGYNTTSELIQGAGGTADAVESWMKAMIVGTVTANLIAGVTLVVIATQKNNPKR